MKSLVVFLLLVTLAVADDSADCAKESGISEEELSLFRKEDHTSKDAKTHCYVKCLLAKKDFFDEEGLPKKDVISKYLTEKNPEKNVKEIMADCLKLSGEGACETAYLRYGCSIEKGILIL